jgi:hypothetical protein
MYVVIVSICIVAAAFVVQRFANQIDEHLNACGTGFFKNGVCECMHPYVGTHCEIVDCGYGKLVDSIFAYDTITTPQGPTGCECESQWWGYSCAQCTSKNKELCTGVCDQNFYGTRCDTLCKVGTENDEEGVEHEQAGGTYNYFTDNGFCLRDGSVKCREGYAGAHCDIPCPDCQYGKCNLDDGTCDCFDGYTGSLCDLTCPGRCSGLNGVCMQVGSQPVCDCYPGFTGEDCSLECCVEGRGTELGSVHGKCTSNEAGCSCFEEVIPLDMPSELVSDVPFNGVGWQGPDCDCHENVTCGGRGRCVEGRCICTANFQGLRCDICADDRIGPFCQYDRWQCPSEDESHGEFVPVNSHGGYGCKCNSGFKGARCEGCIEDAYPKEGDDMCTYIIPGSLCHSGVVKPLYSGTGDMCNCLSHFDVESDCAVCVEGWFGPDCDIECGSDCTRTGGQCLLSGPGCVCPRGKKFDGTECVTCGAGDCSNGECIDGRCQCDPGFYGDLCDISAPKFEGKVCNGFTHVVDEKPAKVRAPCSIADHCTNQTHAVAANRAVALFAKKFDLDMFCHRDDTPAVLKDKSGCCIDRFATGFCEKDMLLEASCEYNNGGAKLEGEMVYDICNQRNLETEVNVYEWCLSRERGCTENGDCADPELCEHMCENQDPAVWQAYWENNHTSSMTNLLSEQWRFPIAFEDPYEYRVPYENATIQGMCAAGGHYKTCRDHLIPDTSVFNVTHKYTGKWERMPSYSCGDVQFLSFDVQGTMNVSISPVMVDAIEALLPNTAVFGRYKSGNDIVFPSMVDSLTLFGKGKVEVVLYNSTNATCTEFIRKAAKDWVTCKDVTFFEFDYDWSGFCSESYNTEGVFNETCYQQSKVCDGCENYQAGCVGLPVNMSSPMPAPCDQGWEEFCPGYLNGSVREGTCAYAKCECEGYGIGGPACSLQCPVPQGVTSELACGSGEDPPWGRCDDIGNGSVALGYEQGLCYCFNGGDPAKGCTKVCDMSQDCSSDVDTPFSFLGNCSGYRNAKQDGSSCSVNLTDSMCNYYRGRCECATPFTVYTIENQTEYMNPNGSYRVALMQGYEIDEYLPFTTHADATAGVAAFDSLDPGFKCFKDINHTQQVSCDWIRALKHFARGGSYRVGDCHKLAPGTKDQVPCSGHGFPVSGTCACDYAEAFEMRSSGVGLAFELPGLTETPWRGKDCGFLCPGYDMQSMDSVCSGHGLCESDGRCSCDQGYTGYKCDLSCEQTQEALTCSGHGTCDERLYRRAGTDEDVLKGTFDSNCVNESMYLARDRVVQEGGVIYHMYEQMGLKVTEYPGTTRDATVEDYFIEGTAVRHPYGYMSAIPFMPCKDTILVKREEAILPSWAGSGTAAVEISCSVLPGYEVRCGQCTCEETSQTGHWVGHDCRTPAVGYYGRDARSTCPGMVDGVPCNGGGTCMWGSLDGKGEVFKSDASVCYCGDPGPSATLATAPRTSNNQFIVHAMNGDTPLYRKVVDFVANVNGTCPEGTVVEGGVCKPTDLALENYNTDCSCKFGWTGTTCETVRMMCLFDGVEDSTSCLCTDENGEPNEKTNNEGCCTKGTYWDQERYRSFQILTDFLVLEDNPVYTSAFLQVCSPVTTEGFDSEKDAVYHMHNYIVSTDEHILTESPCSGTETPLAVAIPRHMEDVDSGTVVPQNVDPVQWCLQECDGSKGFVLGSTCNCRSDLAFMDGPSVFTSELTGSGIRYDIIHPASDCYEDQRGKGVRSDGPNKKFLEPARFLSMGNVETKEVDTIEACFEACTGAYDSFMLSEIVETTYGNISSDSYPYLDTSTPGYTMIAYEEPSYGGSDKLTEIYNGYMEDPVEECSERCSSGSVGFLVGKYPSPTNRTYDENDCLCLKHPHNNVGELGFFRKQFNFYLFKDKPRCTCGNSSLDEVEGRGYYIREYEDNVFKITDFSVPYKNPKPCGIDTYLSYPEMGADCDCPIGDFEESGAGSDSELYSVPLTDMNATLHTCIESCNRAGKLTARVDDSTDFKCFCGMAPEDGSGAYRLTAGTGDCSCPGFYMRGGHAYTCPAGKYSDSCSSTCKQCLVGRWSAAGASECEECPGGWVQNGAESCSKCTAGKFGAKGAHECVECASGKFSESGQESCEICPAGKFGAKGADECVDCASGKFSESGQELCEVCPAGKFGEKKGAHECVDCPSGWAQSSAEKSDCFECGFGYFSEPAQNGCSACPKGSYSNTVGSNTCTQCPTGWYQGDTGKYHCRQCVRIQNNGFDTYYTPDGISCKKCSSGSCPFHGN